MAKTDIFFVQNREKSADNTAFFSKVMLDPALNKQFIIFRQESPDISDVIRDWIVKHGVSSLFYSHMAFDAITGPGHTKDEIEQTILAFLGNLNGVKNLWITDPYFFDDDQDVLILLEKMIKALASHLESITIFTKSTSQHKRAPMMAVFARVQPSLKIKLKHIGLFHDRFWIDPDRNRGVVMGTSINTIMRKIALVDNLRHADVIDIVSQARKLI